MRDGITDREREILCEIVRLFQLGVFRHVPLRTWDVRRAPEAFRFFSQAKQVGKIVLRIPREWDPRGTVLVTGGTGTLGALMARHLVSTGLARHLVLVSRRGREAPGADALLAELTAAGAQVSMVAGDLADPGTAATVIAGIPPEHPLTAVVHSAAALDDGTIMALSRQRLETVFRPKVDAVVQLHEATKDLDLAGFVLFSAAAGIIGSPGQGNYAAANAFLDAFASRRVAQGLPAVSLAWGLWRQASGMTGQMRENDVARMTRSGLDPLTNEQGLSLFDLAMTMDDALVVPIRVEQNVLRSQEAAGLLPQLMRGLVQRSVQRTLAVAPGATAGPPLAARLVGKSAAEQEHIVLEMVRGNLAVVLGHTSTEAIDPHRPFQDMGIDSLTAVELRNRLNGATGLRLSVTLVFDYPTSDALARHILNQLSVESGAATPRHDHDELDDARIWQTINAIPLARIRQAGLLDQLLHLGSPSDGETPPDGALGREAIQSMDVDDLIRMALGDGETSFGTERTDS